MLAAFLLTLHFTRELKLCEHRDLTVTLNIQHPEHTLAANKRSSSSDSREFLQIIYYRNWHHLSKGCSCKQKKLTLALLKLKRKLLKRIRQLTENPRRARLEGHVVKNTQKANQRSGPVETTQHSVPVTCRDTTNTGTKCQDWICC